MLAYRRITTPWFALIYSPFLVLAPHAWRQRVGEWWRAVPNDEMLARTPFD